MSRRHTTVEEWTKHLLEEVLGRPVSVESHVQEDSPLRRLVVRFELLGVAAFHETAFDPEAVIKKPFALTVAIRIVEFINEQLVLRDARLFTEEREKD